MDDVTANLIGPALLLLLGIGLLVAEVFLPSGGIIGLLAFAFFGSSAYLAYSASPTIGLRWALVEGVVIPLAWLAAFRGLARTSLGRAFLLAPPDPEAPGVGTDLGPPVPAVGTEGRAATPLRPAGTVIIDGRRVEALAESNLIAAGAPVRVVGVRSRAVVVREIGNG